VITVKATREGLIGDRTASGYMIDTVVPFVALPSSTALHRYIHVQNPANGKSCIAIVLDVGPWNTSDDAYVFSGARPLAESGQSVSGQGTNGAGIDLGEWVWKQLGMADNSEVEWEFLLL
jgi:hypothetical protein